MSHAPRWPATWVAIAALLGACAFEPATDGETALADSDAADAVPTAYTLEPLGALPGRPSCTPYGMNDRGDIVGECCPTYLASSTCECTGFHWRAGEMRGLAPPPGRDGVLPMAIDDDGDMVGLSWVCGEENRGWARRSGRDVDPNDLLPANSAWRITRLTDLSPSGAVIGWASDGDARRSFVWQRGTFTDLGSLGGPVTNALAIDDDGRVVGGATTAFGEYRSFLWEAGHIEELDVFPESSSASQANAIDGAGRVVGYFDRLDHARAPFGWADGSATALPLTDLVAGVANDVDERGFAVGWCSAFNGSFYYDVACGWTSRGVVDLGARVTTPWEHEPGAAMAVDERGWIAGTSRAASGHVFHAFLLRPAE